MPILKEFSVISEADTPTDPESDDITSRTRKRGPEALGAHVSGNHKSVSRRISVGQSRRSQSQLLVGTVQSSREHRSDPRSVQGSQPVFLDPLSSADSSTPTAQDAVSSASEARLTRKFWRREYIPVHNIFVYDVAKLCLQAEVLSCQPWPSTSAIEDMIYNAWSMARSIRLDERREYYSVRDEWSAEQMPAPVPDDISTEIGGHFPCAQI